MLKFWLKVQCFVCVFTAIQTDDDILVNISNGAIRGRICRDIQDKLYYSFEGIPYAEPPINRNRFQVAKPKKKWNGVLNVTSNYIQCIQISEDKKISGSEDCLYINVYTPVNPNNLSENLPVLIFLHGGSFQRGSSKNIKPNQFMGEGIIFVTLNYRVGVFGFLSTADKILPGNLGLTDQKLALKWVAQNIDKFGGDPNRITLGGQSAGAISISYHLLTSKNEGLFRSVILHSGSALCHHDFEPNPRKYAFELGAVINPFIIYWNNSKKLLRILKKVRCDKLLLASDVITRKNMHEDNPVNLRTLTNVWLPVLENPKQPNAVIPEHMHQALMNKNFLKVPMLAGFTSEESEHFEGRHKTVSQYHLIDKRPALLINDKLNVVDKLKAGKELMSAYTDSFVNNQDALLQYFSDNYYTTPILRQVSLLTNYTPVYLYQFSYDSSPGVYQGVGHTGEIRYLYSEDKLNDEENLVRRRFVKLIKNFVEYQDPTPFSDDLIIKWPPTTSNFELLNINGTLSMITNPRKYETWQKVLDKYARKPFNVY